MLKNKITSAEELAKILEAFRQQGKKIISTNGCFDILHVGHARYLEQAKKLGDILIIGVNSDESVRKLKGPTRPLNPLCDRMEILAALECVDFVFSFEEETPLEWIAKLKPDVHVKGGDYKLETLIEKPIVDTYGGKVVVLPLVQGKSTTNTIKSMQAK